jgi:hypothetical protein
MYITGCITSYPDEQKRNRPLAPEEFFSFDFGDSQIMEQMKHIDSGDALGTYLCTCCDIFELWNAMAVVIEIKKNSDSNGKSRGHSSHTRGCGRGAGAVGGMLTPAFLP